MIGKLVPDRVKSNSDTSVQPRNVEPLTATTLWDSLFSTLTNILTRASNRKLGLLTARQSRQVSVSAILPVPASPLLGSDSPTPQPGPFEGGRSRNRGDTPGRRRPGRRTVGLHDTCPGSVL